VQVPKSRTEIFKELDRHLKLIDDEATEIRLEQQAGEFFFKPLDTAFLLGSCNYRMMLWLID
jgi:hypothetical protein